ncbi:hypothetical protein HELRODRAFT_151008, partial [Helobdella robusta]|uniref:Glutathione S-transferase omega n=1 Tax=Helobdella robusta TaxID=6412 RepID=T1EKI1_HELRO
SPYPPLAPNKVRVYSMRFCPYAQRARMILKYYNVPHEIVNINLKDKPAWFLQKNASGTVPVLEHNERIITESVICCEYLDERYGQNKLLTRESYTRAKQKMMIEKFNKARKGSINYTICKSISVEDFRDLKQQFEEVLQPFEESLQNKFFGGDEPYFLDFLIWPWFERFPALE